MVHIPVLVEEVLTYLVHTTSGVYVDATFGRGGHTTALLGRLAPEARVIGVDRDPEAVAAGEALAGTEDRFTMRRGRFSELEALLVELDLAGHVDGILMDIGVSSPQLDVAERGFSFSADGPLDMRMDPTSGESAGAWLNRADEAEIAKVLKVHCEERFARRIAARIVQARPLHSTRELAEIVSAAVPRAASARQQKHPATRTFQAVRIFVNDEARELEAGLGAAWAALAAGGRLAVISFHSLEDRTVKQTFRRLTSPPEAPRRLPLRADQLTAPGRAIAGPVKAGPAELAANPRARSAVLRVVEKHG